MSKNNLLILCHELPPIGGGTGNFTRHLSAGLGKLDYFSNIIIITSNYRNRFLFKKSDGKVRIYRLPIFRRFLDRTNLFELVSYAVFALAWAVTLSFKYRFKFTLAVHGIPSGVSAFGLFKLTGIPYGVSLRGVDVPGFLPQKYAGFHRKTSFITRLYWKYARFITFNVRETYDLAKDMACSMNDNIRIIPNGVDCDFFTPSRKMEYSVINIIYSGRLTEQKNVELFIRAVHRISNVHGLSSFKVNIAGDGNLRRELEALVSSLGLKDRVKFYGWLDKEPLRSLYQSSHIFVLPSLYEGMSNSLLEAMACGLAVISVNFKGYDDLIRDNENGFLIGSNDLNSLSERLLYMLNNPSLLHSMGIKSRERAMKLSWQSVSAEYLDLISEEIR